MNSCSADIRKAAIDSLFTLSMQVRAYDDLDYILATEGGTVSEEDAEDFCRAYEEYGEAV